MARHFIKTAATRQHHASAVAAGREPNIHPRGRDDPFPRFILAASTDSADETHRLHGEVVLRISTVRGVLHGHLCTYCAPVSLVRDLGDVAGLGERRYPRA